MSEVPFNSFSFTRLTPKRYRIEATDGTPVGDFEFWESHNQFGFAGMAEVVREFAAAREAIEALDSLTKALGGVKADISNHALTGAYFDAIAIVKKARPEQ